VYSVIQVVPDPIRGERINVGVVVWDRTTGALDVEVRPPARALRALDPRFDARFLADLQDQLMAHLMGSAGGRLGLLNGDVVLASLERESVNVLQFTRPGVSSKPFHELTRHLLSRFVDRNAAARHAKSFRDKGMLKRRITRQFGQVGLASQVEKNVAIPRGRVHCAFDYGIRQTDGSFARVVQALSLEARERDALDVARRDLHAFWFDAEQIRHELPATLVAYMRDDGHELETEAHAIVKELDIELVEADDVSDWAVDVAAGLSA
jgi:hypothetical protein